MTFINKFKGYKIRYASSAIKDLNSLDPQIAKSIEEKVKDINKGAENLDIKKLKGYEQPTFRLRHRDYRIIFVESKSEIMILIVAIGHRKAIYKQYRTD